MNNIIKRKWNQNSMVIIEDLQGMAFQAESGGHTFQISGIDGEGNTVALSGTPAGVMLRSDGQDVALTCSVSEGVVSATLPANAYVVPGRFGLTIFMTSDGQKTAIYAAVGTVGKTSSGTVAPPAGSDVVTLVNQINTAIAAIPANYNACFAPAYSTSGLYSVGQYVTYNGNLYRCNTAITTAETWTAAHWTQTNLGADVYDLKSALNFNSENAYASDHVIKSVNDVMAGRYQGAYLNPNYANSKIYDIPENAKKAVIHMDAAGGFNAYTFLNASKQVLGNYYYRPSEDETGAVYTVDIPQEATYIVCGNTAAKFDSIDVYFICESQSVTINDDFAFTTGATTVLSDCNNAKLNTVYLILVTDASQFPSNMPSNAIVGHINYVVTIKNILNNNIFKVQYVFDESFIAIAHRSFSSNAWGNWAVDNAKDDTIKHMNRIFGVTTNIKNVLSDANNALNNTEYCFLATDSTQLPSNLPAWTPKSGSEFYLLTKDMQFINNTGFRAQFLYNKDHKTIAKRNKNNATWSDWTPADGITIEVGSGKDFATLKDAIAAGVKAKNVTLLIYDGTYDFIEEFGGQAYFDSLPATTMGESYDNQYILYNGIKLVFSANSEVVANYNGSNHNVAKNISCFAVPLDHNLDASYEIYNLTIEGKNLDYLFHDDTGSASKPYHRVYKNCRMYLDNSENQGKNAMSCIGGGMGISGEITIENCYFNTEDTDIEARYHADVSYHNGENSGCKGNIHVSDCYFSHTFRVAGYGSSTAITYAYVNNCSMSSALIEDIEVPSAYTIQNMKIVGYCNEMRPN